MDAASDPEMIPGDSRLFDALIEKLPAFGLCSVHRALKGRRKTAQGNERSEATLGLDIRQSRKTGAFAHCFFHRGPARPLF
ncbi:MAG: hypothetical protein JWO82_516 [Akkermansiaceae bacterium]|nr:hypothetical protein [Akkermansiaceae bacterium]